MEAMALESLVASVWRQEGFLTILRHPLRVTRGYSDIDVAGVRADGVVRIGECKARGPAQRVFVDNGRRGWSRWWDASLKNLGLLWKDNPEWLLKTQAISSVEFHLVGNVWFPNEAGKRRAEARLVRKVRSQLPRTLRRSARAIVTPSIDLFVATLATVHRDVVELKWGKRYGDPLLDAVRELVRYLYPAPAGGVRSPKAIIVEEARKAFERALPRMT